MIHGDINQEILDYSANSFNYVILSQTLQQVYQPATLLKNILRVGKKGIVSFPNFSYWGIRFQLFTKGIAPVTRELPYDWYDTPNIRIITIKDFRQFSKNVGFKIYKEVGINMLKNEMKGRFIRLLPTLRASYGIFMIGKEI